MPHLNHVITLINQNGGCGKTTLTVHLACWLAQRGLNIVVIDADPQAATASWLKRVAPKVRVLALLEANQIEDAVGALLPHVDAIVADTKPGLDPAALMLAKLASQGSGVRSQGSGISQVRSQASGVRGQQSRDSAETQLTPDSCLLTPGPTGRVLMPVLPSKINIRGTLQAIGTLNALGLPLTCCHAFLNQVKSGNAHAGMTRGRLAELGVIGAAASIADREAFKWSAENDTVVWLLKNVNAGLTQAGRLAAQELDTLFNEVLPHELIERLDKRSGSNGRIAGGNDPAGECVGATGAAA